MINIAIYGMGKLGRAVAEKLSDLPDIVFFKHSYTEGGSFHLVCGKKDVEVLDSAKLRLHDEQRHLIKDVDVIIVTLTGAVLEKEIDFLLDLHVPLVVCSTGYNVEMVKQKAEDAFVSVIMSENFALPVLKFWQQIQNLEKLPDGLLARLHVVESHQTSKRGFSGTAIKEMNLFAEQGFLVEMPSLSDFRNGKISTSGGLTSIRNKSKSLKIGVPEESLGEHSYHRLFIHFDTKGIEEHVEYVNYLYEYFKVLEKLSIEGIFHFEVKMVRNGVQITHNLNGLGLSLAGIIQALLYLDINRGQFTGHDLLDH